MKTTGRKARGLAIGGRLAGLTIAVAGLAGCVQIETPDKPIEINLNINIKQEIVYRLDGDAKKLIEQNSSIF